MRMLERHPAPRLRAAAELVRNLQLDVHLVVEERRGADAHEREHGREEGEEGEHGRDAEHAAHRVGSVRVEPSRIVSVFAFARSETPSGGEEMRQPVQPRRGARRRS